MWNPEHDALRHDDALVCYGELTELRAAAPSHAGRAAALMFDEPSDGPEQTEG